MSEMFEAADEVLDEMFPPKPGGLVDRHRKRKAQEKAAEQQAQQEAEAIEERSYKAVKVAVEQPESLSAQSFVINAGGFTQILPAYMYRKRAVVSMAWSGAGSPTGSPVAILSKDQGALVSMPSLSAGLQPVGGFYLYTGLLLSVESRAQLWAGNPSAFPIVISVYSEFYGPEK